MNSGVIQSSRKDGALVIMLPRWNANIWLYISQASPGAQALLFYTLSYVYALSFKELNETHLHIYIYPYPMSPISMLESCRLLCYRIRQKSSDCLSLTRDRKYIIIASILLSPEKIYMNDNWRPGGMVIWIRTWFGIRARLGLHLFRLCRLRTGCCIGFWSGHKLIILSTYLFMGAGKTRCSLVVGSDSFQID